MVHEETGETRSDDKLDRAITALQNAHLWFTDNARLFPQEMYGSMEPNVYYNRVGLAEDNKFYAERVAFVLAQLTEEK